ncbi:O-methyltransferase [Myroides sp. LJL110]
MNNVIFSQVDQYISQRLAPEDSILKQTIESLDHNGLPQHSVSANQGKFLQLFMALSKAKNVLELGTLGGYSTIWMARALPIDGKITTIEVDTAHARVAKENFKKADILDKVDLKIGKALDILPTLIQEEAKKFDLIFIDADKPPYTQYYEYALQLSNPGTVIILDNVIREAQILDKDSIDPRL